MPPFLAVLGPLIQAAVSWFQTTGFALIEKLLIYRKGAKDQRVKDDVARLEREGHEVSRAAERIGEERTDALEQDAAGRKPGADTIRVRRPGDDLKW